MKHLLLALILALAAPAIGSAQFTPNQLQMIMSNSSGTDIVEKDVVVTSGGYLSFDASFNPIMRVPVSSVQISGGDSHISSSGGPITSSGTFTISLNSVVFSDSSYTNPAWIVSIPFSKISATPTTLSGYGITDGVTSASMNSAISSALTSYSTTSAMNTSISSATSGLLSISAASSTYATSASLVSALSFVASTYVPWSAMTGYVPTTSVIISPSKSLTVTNSVTIGGTDGSTLNIGSGGSLGSAAFLASTAFDTAGAAAAATSTALQKANNLSDLPNASTARTNLGLGSASTSNSSDFDASGAASAALTSANANALQRASNLSDLPSASTARSNLGLGTASTSATSAFDVSGAASSAQASAVALSLQKASNLSDLASATAARTNLGLGSASTSAASSFVQSISGSGSIAISGTMPNLTISSTNPKIQTGRLQTDTSGNLTWTYSTAFSAAPIVSALSESSSTSTSFNVQVISISSTSATFKVFGNAPTLISLLGINLLTPATNPQCYLQLSAFGN